jgi:hypothetical protein
MIKESIYIVKHQALKGKTISKKYRREIEGQNKWLILLQDASKIQNKMKER